MKDYNKQNKYVTLPNGLVKCAEDVTEQEMQSVIAWRKSFGHPSTDKADFHPENVGEKDESKQLKNCDSCGLFDVWDTDIAYVRPCRKNTNPNATCDIATDWRVQNLKADSHDCYCAVKTGADNCPKWEQK